MPEPIYKELVTLSKMRFSYIQNVLRTETLPLGDEKVYGFI
jgi:hypothetical protein